MPSNRPTSHVSPDDYGPIQNHVAKQVCIIDKPLSYIFDMNHEISP